MIKQTISVDLPDEQATLAAGARLADQNGLIFLRGELGAGKTTLVRGYLRGLGYDGVVKSPTYTLVEPYDINGRRLLHLDIYRLNDALELENIGVRDEWRQGNTLLIEWPERAQGYLGTPDLDIDLQYADNARRMRLTPANAAQAEAIRRLFSQLK